MSTIKVTASRTNPTSTILSQLWGCSIARSVIAGLVGGMAMNLAMLLTFRMIGFGANADGILLDPAIQSPKLIAVWTKLEPLPLVVANPLPIVVGLLGFAVVHGFLYRWLSVSWPKGVVARGWRFAMIVLLMSYGFWEFFTPFNQLGEPVRLIAIELIFWSVVAAAEGFAIAALFEIAPPSDRCLSAGCKA